MNSFFSAASFISLHRRSAVFAKRILVVGYMRDKNISRNIEWRASVSTKYFALFPRLYHCALSIPIRASCIRSRKPEISVYFRSAIVLSGAANELKSAEISTLLVNTKYSKQVVQFNNGA